MSYRIYEEENEKAIEDKLLSFLASLGLKKKRVAILCSFYPSLENIYSGGFFHSLVRWYKRLMPLIVVVPSTDLERYTYEGIEVLKAPYNEIYKEILHFKPDIVLGMGAYREVLLLASSMRKLINCPFCTFIVGSDGLYLPVYRPMERIQDIHRRGYINDFIKKLRLRRFLREGDERGDFIVHPSHWLREAVEKSTFYRAKNVKIIPFPVDTTIFKFQPRRGKVKKLVCVKSHSSRVYAVDLVISASRGKYETHIYGTGKLLYKHIALARKLGANVKFLPRFFPHKELAEIYLRYDMGLMLSRADSQGVSTCEMQATGLPVITSAIQAIPEFATRGTILIKNSEVDKVEGIIDEINEKGILEKLSYEAHNGIVEKCGIARVMKEHLLLIHQIFSIRRG